MPIRIQRKREAGWRMPAGAIYIGRPTPFENWIIAGKPVRGDTSDAKRSAGFKFRDIFPACTAQFHIGHEIARADAAEWFHRWLIDGDDPSEFIPVWPTYTAEAGYDGMVIPALARVRQFILHQAPLQLAGRDLACWCPLDEPCHVDTVLAVANGGYPWIKGARDG